MFNTIIHHRDVSRVTENVNVTENRAPTDQSVKLLREMEASARAEVLKSIRVSNTHIEAVVEWRHDHLNAANQYAIVYEVNGLRRRVDHAQHQMLRPPEDERQRLADALVKALSEDIARHMLGGLGRQIMESLNHA